MAYADQPMSRNRITAIVIVALIHLALGYALVTGLAYEGMQKVIEKVTTVDIKEEVKKEEPPPPPPKKEALPPPPVAPPVKINVAPTPPQIQTVTTPPPPAPIILAPPPVVAPPPPPPPPPTVNKSRGVSPKGQSGWARRIQDNYPARALRDEREGRVGVRVTIGPDGRVSACSVSSSSGSPDLDAAACEGMQRHARYEPALDAAGNPITASTSTTIVYQIN
jgi:periplasmic protein TonB